MTVKGPKGRMTKPLTTKFNVGDVVKLTKAQETPNGEWAPRVGDLGVIRRIIISDPNDGDATWLMFWVRFAKWGRTTLLAEHELKRAKVAA